MAAPAKQPEPRRHHYVPRCCLAGFTDTGENDGSLFVTDFKRSNQWPASPGSAGFIRDFYRLEDERVEDPVIAEKALSQIEDVIAPILRRIDKDTRGPTEEELVHLLYFMAIQWTRVPAFRPLVLSLFDKISYERISEMLKSPETLRRSLVEPGMDPDAPGAKYDQMKKFHDDKTYKLTAPTDWYVLEAFKAVENILPGLKRRYWATLISPSGGFIANDNPVILDGRKGEQVGFENAEVVSFAVSRHVLLWGTLKPTKQPFLNRKFIAIVNTLSLLYGDEQVFSQAPNRCWLDENHKYQTDWKLFSKDKY